MNSCYHCNKKATWHCECSNVILCQDHKDLHLASSGNHQIRLLKVLLDDSIKARVHDEAIKIMF